MTAAAGGGGVPVRLTPRSERPAFPNYTELPTRVPLRAWRIGRVVTLGIAVALCVELFVRPATGLKLTWGVLVPCLPIVWFTMPGLWRNLCPLATSNQLPRVLGITRGRRAPAVMARFAYGFGLAALLVLVPARKVLFNRSGPATAVLLLAVLGLAFSGGLLLKGKSGWCSTVCPLLPVQRLYGETPFLLVRNSHCEPCVGCAKNCYDFNPRVAKLADLADDDPRYAALRRLFAAAFPGLVLGFFSMPNVPARSVVSVYGRIGLYVGVSIAVFTVIEALAPVTVHQLTALFAAAALNAFYWYGTRTLVATVTGSTAGAARNVAVWGGRGIVLALTVPWLVRTFAKESAFLAAGAGAPVVSAAGLAVLGRDAGRDPSVRFAPDGPEVAVAVGTPLLDVIEDAGLPVEAGCRMGVCGADPVAILAGHDALSPPTRDEVATLERLGLAGANRLACQARVQGGCTVSLVPDRAAGPPRSGAAPRFVPDPEVGRLVVLGNGIAGSTAVDHARRLHPDCHIDVVGAEPHRLYNRMAISRLIHGRSAMQGLYLLPDAWYDENGVTSWLNTRARAVDLAARTVALATGETLPYDRLIIATGSRSTVPDLPGIGLPGNFTLRLAEDAMAVRSYLQEHDVRAAVVTGGGLLGVECAYALHRLGVETTVLAREPWLLPLQLDEPAARLLERYLEALGIAIATQATAAEVLGSGRVEGVALADGRVLTCGVHIACAGTRPDVTLAREAGLVVGRGIVVDDRLRTSDPHVYAAGDVAEVEGHVSGLWPDAARAGEVAAVNAVGGTAVHELRPATTLLKVVGVEVASIGRIETTFDDVVVTVDEPEDARYRKLVVTEGRAVGAILVGHGRDVPAVQQAVEDGRDVSAALDALRAGDWSVLAPSPVSA